MLKKKEIIAHTWEAVELVLFAVTGLTLETVAIFRYIERCNTFTFTSTARNHV